MGISPGGGGITISEELLLPGKTGGKSGVGVRSVRKGVPGGRTPGPGVGWKPGGSCCPCWRITGGGGTCPGGTTTVAGAVPGVAATNTKSQ